MVGAQIEMLECAYGPDWRSPLPHRIRRNETLHLFPDTRDSATIPRDNLTLYPMKGIRDWTGYFWDKNGLTTTLRLASTLVPVLSTHTHSDSR